LKIDYYKKTSSALSKQKPHTPSEPRASEGADSGADPSPLDKRTAPMRIIIHYLFSTLVLSLYGGQV
jgi:hypothetical protein